jgi:S1-C subfamily serine protease
MQFQTFILISLTVLLTACGKPESKSIARKKVRITQEQMSLVLAHQNITCGDQDFCPEGIARMFAINFEDASNSSTCSAFLVAPDVVMTNTHCVFGNKLSLEKICSGLYFAFPSQGLTHTAQCSKILWRDRHQNGRHHYRDGDNDFALIRLDRNIPLTPLKLLTGSLKRGAEVHPVVVDQIGGFDARVTKLTCRVEKIIPKYGVLQLANCPVISGNSGSPVLDKDQNVVGVIFASSNNKIKKPSDELSVRTKSDSKGFAFSIDHIQNIIGHLL